MPGRHTGGLQTLVLFQVKVWEKTTQQCSGTSETERGGRAAAVRGGAASEHGDAAVSVRHADPAAAAARALVRHWTTTDLGK